MNLKLGIGIWYRYWNEFRVAVSGIGIGSNLGYKYWYRFLANTTMVRYPLESGYVRNKCDATSDIFS